MNSENSIKTADSFLLEVEYGEMLYRNPRGISCSKCHGKEGKGGHKIAKYYDKYKNPKILKGADITAYSFEELKASLKNRYRDKKNRRVRHKIMPMYYLTDEEVKAIYSYLQEVKKR
jgi:mono/diheme cytochrome c family protein